MLCFYGLVLHYCATRWSFSCLVFIDKQGIILVILYILLESVIFGEDSVFDFALILDLVEPWASETI